MTTDQLTWVGCESVLLVSRVLRSHMAMLVTIRKVTICLPGLVSTWYRLLTNLKRTRGS